VPQADIGILFNNFVVLPFPRFELTKINNLINAHNWTFTPQWPVGSSLPTKVEILENKDLFKMNSTFRYLT